MNRTANDKRRADLSSAGPDKKAPTKTMDVAALENADSSAKDDALTVESLMESLAAVLNKYNGAHTRTGFNGNTRS